MTVENSLQSPQDPNESNPPIAENEIDIILFAELARPFAAGKIRNVCNSLDFTEVVQAVLDNKLTETQSWIEDELITPLDDDTAISWIHSKKILKAAVLAPWVFVQDSISN